MENEQERIPKYLNFRFNGCRICRDDDVYLSFSFENPLTSRLG